MIIIFVSQYAIMIMFGCISYTSSKLAKSIEILHLSDLLLIKITLGIDSEH